jgi:GNAT superfamily N-acetyltransferase
MNIRPPREAELPIVRALLPAEAVMPAGRTFRLAFDESGSLAGAVSWRDEGAALNSLRLHIIPARRRQRIGTQLLDYANKIAADAGRTLLIAEADLKNEPAAEPFLAARGFELTGRLTSVEQDIEKLMPKTAMWEEQLRNAGQFPEGSRLVKAREAPADQIVELFQGYIAHIPVLAGMMRHFKIEDYPDSVALMLGTDVIGFVLAQVNDGVLYVPAWVIKREYQSQGIGTSLLGALRPVLAGRILRRIRFEFTDHALHTAKLASRYEYEIMKVWARFERPVG